MFEGKVKATLRVLNESGSKTAQPLSLSSPFPATDPSLGTVQDALFKRHSDSAPVSLAHCLLTETPPLIMNHILSTLIRLMVF